MNSPPGGDLGAGPAGPAAQPSHGQGGRRGVLAAARRALWVESILTVSDWRTALTTGLTYAVVFVVGVVLRSQFLLLLGSFAALSWLARACVLLGRNRERRSRDGA